MNHKWAASYCEGWDGPAGKPVGALLPEEARRRDAAGLPYSVLITEDDQPRFVLDIAWQQDHLVCWSLDEQGRRSSRAVHRRLENGQLFEQKLTSWQYDDDQQDGDPDVPRETFDRSLNGSTTVYRRFRKGGGHPSAQESPADFMRAPVTFGSWHSVLGIADLTEVQPSEASSEVSIRPWHPPKPFEASYLDQLMVEGSTVVFNDTKTPMRVRHQHLGNLTLPTGRVVACDPTYGEVIEAFTMTVEPGDYPVVEIQIHDEEDGYATDAGYLLGISDEPTTTWELALQPGQDPRELGDGEFYGFGVDSGQGCFLDESAQKPLIDHIDGDLHQWYDEMLLGEEYVIPGSDLNVFAYGCYYGDGSYPTWIGRDAHGSVTCFLSDMLIVETARGHADISDFEKDW